MKTISTKFASPNPFALLDGWDMFFWQRAPEGAQPMGEGEDWLEMERRTR